MIQRVYLSGNTWNSSCSPLLGYAVFYALISILPSYALALDELSEIDRLQPQQIYKNYQTFTDSSMNSRPTVQSENKQPEGECGTSSGFPMDYRLGKVVVNGVFQYDEKAQGAFEAASKMNHLTLYEAFCVGLITCFPCFSNPSWDKFLKDQRVNMGELERAYTAVQPLKSRHLASCRRQLLRLSGRDTNTIRIVELDFSRPTSLARNQEYVNPLFSSTKEFDFYLSQCPDVFGLKLRGALQEKEHDRWQELRNSSNNEYSKAIRLRPSKLRNQLKRLKEFKNLKGLDLSENILTEVNLSTLPSTLELLKLNGSTLRGGQVRELMSQKNLRRLELRNVYRDGDLQQEVANVRLLVHHLTSLKEIVFENSPAGRFYQEYLPRFEPRVRVILK